MVAEGRDLRTDAVAVGVKPYIEALEKEFVATTDPAPLPGEARKRARGF